MTKVLVSVDTYENLLSRLEEEIAQSRSRIQKAVQQEKISTYWRIGQYISDHLLAHKRADYGKNLFSRLSQDLDIAQSNLYSMVQFYKAFPIFHPDGKLGWAHYSILSSVKDQDKRQFLAKEAQKNQWSKRQLQEVLKQQKIQLEAFEENAPVEEAPLVIRTTSKLAFERGKLFTYRIIKPKYISTSEAEFNVDCGFSVFRNVPLSGITSVSQDMIVESIKTEEDCTFRVSNEPKSKLYTYKAFVRKIIDADTIWVDIDLGFNTWIFQKLRFRGIDAAELSTKKGQQAVQFVNSQLSKVSFVVIKTYGSDKYDRYLVDVFYLKGARTAQKVLEEGVYLNQRLLEEDLAVLVN